MVLEANFRNLVAYLRAVEVEFCLENRVFVIRLKLGVDILLQNRFLGDGFWDTGWELRGFLSEGKREEERWNGTVVPR